MRRVRADGTRFVDDLGRHVLLRGVNLGGDCKVPYPDGGTDRPSDFSDHREVSFIGRPFPLDEADQHLGRLRDWGFNCLRLLTTWEAVEHAGPGRYDAAYLDYFAEVCRRAGEHGMQVFVDFHQDVWSRMTGGDGAPAWVFEALGLDFNRFDAAGAASVMQWRYDYASEVKRQEDRYPMMSWSRNYHLPVNGICWTAFFAGGTITPGWMVEGENVQDFLQGHYIGALRAVAERVKDLPNVMGFDSLNEPGSGWVGQRLSYRHTERSPDNPRPPRPGVVWSPLDGLAAAAGLTVELPVLVSDPDAGRQSVKVGGQQTVNASRTRIWASDAPDPFEQAGVWRRDGDRAVVVNDDAFRLAGNHELEMERDFMSPFFARVAEAMREVRGDWLLFAEVDPYVVGIGRGMPSMPAGSVNASHWYDIRTLGTKTFDPDFDNDRLRDRYTRELAVIRKAGDDADVPSLIGEFGIPYDLNGGEAYAAWDRGERDVWRAHETALGLMYDGLDANLLSSTHWNYTASNRNDLRIGDGWNQEDLSIYSADQTDGPDDGGRAVKGFARPYVSAAQGVVVSQVFDRGAGVFEAEIEVDKAIDAPTQIAAPAAWFAGGASISCAGPAAEARPTSAGFEVLASESGRLTICIRAG